MIEEPVAVVAQGFGWTAAGAWASFLAILGLIIRQIGPWRKTNIAAQERLRDDLLKRVERLEETLERERARHSAERALDRHRLNNIQACFDALILLLQAAPEKAAETVERIQAMRADQMKAEALEKAQIHAANIPPEGEGS